MSIRDQAILDNLEKEVRGKEIIFIPGKRTSNPPVYYTDLTPLAPAAKAKKPKISHQVSARKAKKKETFHQANSSKKKPPPMDVNAAAEIILVPVPPVKINEKTTVYPKVASVSMPSDGGRICNNCGYKSRQNLQKGTNAFCVKAADMSCFMKCKKCEALMCKQCATDFHRYITEKGLTESDFLWLKHCSRFLDSNAKEYHVDARDSTCCGLEYLLLPSRLQQFEVFLKQKFPEEQQGIEVSIPAPEVVGKTTPTSPVEASPSNELLEILQSIKRAPHLDGLLVFPDYRAAVAPSFKDLDIISCSEGLNPRTPSARHLVTSALNAAKLEIKGVRPKVDGNGMAWF
jgi:hypothetical protein